ncbi:MAG: chemotaxis protein CheW [Verrucomicrobiae bacterium]|nr:chemotaxis protein CheW [Verrucomicrobiae bacterium]
MDNIELIREFIAEGREHLAQVEADLVALEKNPQDRDILSRIFRAVHTIKGASGFLGLKKLEALTHAGENLLSRLRDGRMAVNQEITTLLLNLVDTLQQALGMIEAQGHDAALQHTPLTLKINRLLQNQPAPAADAAPKSAPEHPTPSPAPAPGAGAGEQTHPNPGPVPHKESEAAPAVAPAASTTASVAESHVRVDVGLLDRLMNLVGELVLARNQILQLSDHSEHTQLNTVAQRLNLVTTELQEEVMKTRLQPIQNAWNKLPRVVRDTAMALGRQVQLELIGQDTELDRAIIEAIKDPMLHLVRNALDHGLEPPAERKAAGKPETGHLTLRAFHEGGQVNIEVTDDGRGIQPAKVKAKALEKGLITAEQAHRMTDREAFHLLFLPGFSTAEKVTNVSGRGVGMDVVKTNIEKLGGSVDVESTPGQGTTVKIKIPLTLAIIPALLVTCGSQRYAVPQVNLVELVRVEAEQRRRQIEEIMGAPVCRLRGRLLPLVYLSRVFHIPPAMDDQGAVNIVVLQADNQQFGLVVDCINDTCEIVVKPLGKHLKRIPVFAGATVLGDGTVALILDVLGLAQHARVLRQMQDHERHRLDATATARQTAARQLLLCALGPQRLAIDLATVGRLEKIPRARVEQAGGREVVQYRGKLMDLVRLSHFLGYAEPEDGDLNVVVYSSHDRTVGLVVGSILDILEQAVELDAHEARPGIQGRCVIQGRTTELVDVPGVVQAAGLITATV